MQEGYQTTIHAPTPQGRVAVTLAGVGELELELDELVDRTVAVMQKIPD